jgi:hypothetical protein
LGSQAYYDVYGSAPPGPVSIRGLARVQDPGAKMPTASKEISTLVSDAILKITALNVSDFKTQGIICHVGIADASKNPVMLVVPSGWFVAMASLNKTAVTGIKLPFISKGEASKSNMSIIVKNAELMKLLV